MVFCLAGVQTTATTLEKCFSAIKIKLYNPLNSTAQWTIANNALNPLSVRLLTQLNLFDSSPYSRRKLGRSPNLHDGMQSQLQSDHSLPWLPRQGWVSPTQPTIGTI